MLMFADIKRWAVGLYWIALQVTDGIRLWADGAYWRTWLTHTVLAVPILLLVGPLPTVTYFKLREMEQFSHAAMRNRFAPWWDYVMDVVGPDLLALLWFVLELPVWLT